MEVSWKHYNVILVYLMSCLLRSNPHVDYSEGIYYNILYLIRSLKVWSANFGYHGNVCTEMFVTVKVELH